MIRRLIDRFRWWLVPGDVLRVEQDWTFFSPALFSSARIHLKRGTLLVFVGRRTETEFGGRTLTTVAVSFAGTEVAIYPMDLKRLTRLRRYQPDLT